MKISFLMLDGFSQVVLTPESEAERAVLDLLHQGGHTVSVERGEFRETTGGYAREFGAYSLPTHKKPADTMLVLRPAKAQALPLDRTEIAAQVRAAVMATPLRFLGDGTTREGERNHEVAHSFRLEMAEAAHDAAVGMEP